mmetsp:Transcript_58189/g.138562  ORF Transcript_58189/g.138562 Transcript_58189/m.138562 type:complete len:203 (-) Transcript_58189:143-751(-)
MSSPTAHSEAETVAPNHLTTPPVAPLAPLPQLVCGSLPSLLALAAALAAAPASTPGKDRRPTRRSLEGPTLALSHPSRPTSAASTWPPDSSWAHSWTPRRQLILAVSASRTTWMSLPSWSACRAQLPWLTTSTSRSWRSGTRSRRPRPWSTCSRSPRLAKEWMTPSGSQRSSPAFGPESQAASQRSQTCQRTRRTFGRRPMT